MSREKRQKAVKALIGIGVLLVGLLGGILFMLVVRPTPAVSPAVSPVVERVQLGSRSLERPQSVADDSAVSAVPDPFTLNRYFRRVAEEVTPAVVFIQVEAGGSVDPSGEWFHGDRESRRRFFEERFPRQSVGSGVIISEHGHVITNNHVIDGAEKITVTLADKRQYEAVLVGVDRSTDLAVIQIGDVSDLPIARFGDSDRVEVGEWVLAVGNPFRLTSTVTAGIVSALGRQVNIIDDNFRIEDFIQTDAAINPGNSGGALVNLNGELVGINTAIATDGGSYEGYGFAVPVNLMERVAGDLIAHGEVRRGFLGVSLQEIDSKVANRIGLASIGGVYVNEVRRDGAAFQGGVRDGDVVLAIGGKPVNAPNQLQSAVARYRPGERLDVEIWRDGQRLDLDVELLGRDAPAYERWFAELSRDTQAPEVPQFERDTPGPDSFTLEDHGFGVRELSDLDRRSFGVESGVYISFVQNGTAAARSGLPRDVVIVAIDGEEVASTDDVLRLTELAGETADPALLHVRHRTGILAFYELLSGPSL